MPRLDKIKMWLSKSGHVISFDVDKPNPVCFDQLLSMHQQYIVEIVACIEKLC